ncbi:MAG: hypothetical protein FJX03_01940 [Alphaproteobacteria bacterium]|nr:hypothetical protein [Alphaproteobacteria bacterium]
MIRNFRCKKTEKLFGDKYVGDFSNFQDQARRKLFMINAAHNLNDLTVPPGNKLEKLVGNRGGQHSIRINNQWRICFEWENGAAINVEIVDYH